MMIRYFCRVAPGEAGDVSYLYLSELRRLSIPTRALPIGGAAALGFDRRWFDIGDSFTVAMAIPFINIVCAPLGMLLGTRTPLTAMGTSTDLPHELGQVLGPSARRTQAAPTLVYEPQTAFVGLHTAGARNIAIVDGALDSPGETEIAALKRYDLVIVPDFLHETAHRISGVKTVYVPANANRLAEVIGELCELGTSLTLVHCQATDELPATTSPHLSSTAAKTTDSSSRSPHGETLLRAQSPDTPTSTLSFAQRSSAKARAMWRFITRRHDS